MYTPSIDVTRLKAIDVHVHLEPPGDQSAASEAAKQYFKDTGVPREGAALADYYRSRDMACVVFTVDETLSGVRRLTNDQVVEFALANTDIAIPFASLNPTRGAEAVREARRLVDAGVVRGLKLHPPIQLFSPDDRIAYPLYEVFAEKKLPVLFHTGHSGIGSGMRCGGGLRLEYSNPMHLDDVAIAFPDMQIVIAHPSWPWQDEALSVAMHKPNVWIDLSGWSPKYFPPQLVQYANTLLRDRVLSGSDWPLISPDRWMKDFEQAGFRDEAKPLILKDNAVRLLGLA